MTRNTPDSLIPGPVRAAKSSSPMSPNPRSAMRLRITRVCYGVCSHQGPHQGPLFDQCLPGYYGPSIPTRTPAIASDGMGMGTYSPLVSSRATASTISLPKFSFTSSLAVDTSTPDTLTNPQVPTLGPADGSSIKPLFGVCQETRESAGLDGRAF